MFDPLETRRAPVDGNQIRPAIAVDVEHLMSIPVWPAAADLDGSQEVFLPGGRLVPVAAAHDIEFAILVDVEDRGGQELRIGVDDVAAKHDVIAAARSKCRDSQQQGQTAERWSCGG